MAFLSFLRRPTRKFGWKKDWQDRLSALLEKATTRLKINVVFVVAEESDPYSELLFLFSFVGVTVGSFIGLAFKVLSIDAGIDLYVFPLLGFTMFGLLHVKKNIWLRTRFRNLAQKRVNLKARSFFYDYCANSSAPMVLIYLSESEVLLDILRSPELKDVLHEERTKALIKEFLAEFKIDNPIVAIEKLIDQIINMLTPAVQEFHIDENEDGGGFSPPVFVPASDFDIRVVPILKGNKDVN
jgi:hypothetical protein